MSRSPGKLSSSRAREEVREGLPFFKQESSNKSTAQAVEADS
jgi:hypothetical protein